MTCLVSNGNSVLLKIRFEFTDFDFTEVKNTRRKRRIRMAQYKRIDKMRRCARATRGDDRNVEQLIEFLKRVNCKPILGPVVIHAGEQDLTRATVLTFFRPGEKFLVGYLGATMRKYHPG